MCTEPPPLTAVFHAGALASVTPYQVPSAAPLHVGSGAAVVVANCILPPDRVPPRVTVLPASPSVVLPIDVRAGNFDSRSRTLPAPLRQRTRGPRCLARLRGDERGSALDRLPRDRCCACA